MEQISDRDDAHARGVYATMTVPQIVELRRTFELGAKKASTERARAFIRRRLELLDAELGRRLN